MTELSENKTLLDQLYGKMNPSTSTGESRDIILSALKRFIVALIQLDGTDIPDQLELMCYGTLISKKIFVSTIICMAETNVVAIANPESVKKYDNLLHYADGSLITSNLRVGKVSILV